MTEKKKGFVENIIDAAFDFGAAAIGNSVAGPVGAAVAVGTLHWLRDQGEKEEKKDD